MRHLFRVEVARRSSDTLTLYSQHHDRIEAGFRNQPELDLTDRKLLHQNGNPVKVLTSGKQSRTGTGFVAGGEIRYEEESSGGTTTKIDNCACSVITRTKHLQLAGELRSDGTAQREGGNAGLEFVKLVIHSADVGDLDAPFEHLQRGLDAHDPALVHLAVAPQWDSLRADPRFTSAS